MKDTGKCRARAAITGAILSVVAAAVSSEAAVACCRNHEEFAAACRAQGGIPNKNPLTCSEASSAPSVPRGPSASDLPSRIANVQAENGDLAGALGTTASIEKDRKDYYTRSMVQASFALSQSKAGDIGGARKLLALARQTADLVADAARKESVLRHIALIQAGSGDVAGALAVAGQIPSAYLKAQTQGEIVVAQAKAGDVAGAVKTADVIQYPDDYIKNDALFRVAEIQAEDARFKAGDQATLWRQRLADSNLDHDGALGAAPFLDLPGHLQSLAASEDPRQLFAGLYRTFSDMIDAEIVVNRLLEMQTRK